MTFILLSLLRIRRIMSHTTLVKISFLFTRLTYLNRGLRREAPILFFFLSFWFFHPEGSVWISLFIYYLYLFFIYFYLFVMDFLLDVGAGFIVLLRSGQFLSFSYLFFRYGHVTWGFSYWFLFRKWQDRIRPSAQKC